MQFEIWSCPDGSKLEIGQQVPQDGGTLEMIEISIGCGISGPCTSTFLFLGDTSSARDYYRAAWDLRRARLQYRIVLQ